jgi:hypothetical protein
MIFRKKREQNVSLDIAREELRHSQERESHVIRVVNKVSQTLEENHIAPNIRRALYPPSKSA